MFSFRKRNLKRIKSTLIIRYNESSTTETFKLEKNIIYTRTHAHTDKCKAPGDFEKPGQTIQKSTSSENLVKKKIQQKTNEH